VVAVGAALPTCLLFTRLVDLDLFIIVDSLLTHSFLLLLIEISLVAMSVDEAKIPNFTHLNDENYSLWVIHMEANLVSHKLWGQVVYEGNTDVKTVEELEAVVLDWKKKRKKMAEVWAAIIQRVEDSQLTHIQDQDPAVIWEELASIHLSCGLVTHLALSRKFLKSL
jgi:hypothetical protein